MDLNLLASVGGVLITGSVTVGIALYSRRHTVSDRYDEMRLRFDAALLEMPPKIIEEQNRRIDALVTQYQECERRERECRQKLNEAFSRIAALERRQDGHLG